MRIAKSVIARRAAEPSVSSPCVPATAASIASQVVRSPRVAAPRSASIVLSPIFRLGTLMIRSKLTTSVSERRTRRYASASLTSRRW